jgi:hypothetical protein
MGVKTTTKKRFTKEIMSKGFYKIFDPKSQTDFFSLFRAFLGEGNSKTRKQNIEIGLLVEYFVKAFTHDFLCKTFFVVPLTPIAEKHPKPR